MSALPPKADIGTQSWNVRLVPKADICSAAKIPLFDHFVGETLKSGHWLSRLACPLCAKSGLMRRSKGEGR